ncbi:MAG: PAS domain S-box protein [Gammaproteobacteria bacterium]|nr:PAS domain S-box protein [Gammaproteobacteria bacterium]
MNSDQFERLFRYRIVLTWSIPPVIGLGFILFIHIFTFEQMLTILTTPLEPAFIFGWLLFAPWYLGKRIKPVVEFLKTNGSGSEEPALQAMQDFPLRYWSSFLIYIILAPSSVILSAELYTDFTATATDWLRIHMVAVIVSIVVGLPIFFSILDLFGRALQGVKLRKPHITLKTKILLIGALVPLLIDTMIVQYYWSRTGYFTFETFIVWLSLELMAIAGSILFLRSIGRSLTSLETVIKRDREPYNIPDNESVPMTTDEIGVLISDHTELLNDLKIQRDVLEFRNRLLRDGGNSADINTSIENILDLSRRALDCDHVFIFVHDRKKKVSRCIAISDKGYSEQGHIVLPQSNSSIMQSMRNTAEVIRVDDATGNEVIQQALSGYEVGSLVIAPLIIENEVAGAMIAARRDVRFYEARDEAIINGLAQETGIIVQNHWLKLERQRTTAVRRDREARISLLLDSTSEAIFGVDLEGNCTFVNQSCLHMLGYDHEDELLGKNIHAMIHHTRPNGEPYPKEECRVRLATLAGKDEHCDEEVHWRRDGSSFPVEYWSHPIQSNGHTIGTVVTFVDISERLEAEQALRRSEERYALAQEAARIGSWELNMKTNELIWSETIEPMFGMQPGEFSGSLDDYMSRVHPEDIEMLQSSLSELVGLKNTFETEHRIIWPDGSIHWMAGRAKLYRDEEGKPDRLIGIVQDVTKRHLAEVELALHRHQLEKLVDKRTLELKAINQELEAFSYSVSHDLRAPLRSIDGFSQALLEDYTDKLDEVGADYLKRVRRAAQRMGVLIDDMLQLSRVSRRTVEPTEVNISDLAQEIGDELSKQHEQRKVEFHVEPGLIDHADPGLLRILLINLLANAWKFTSKTSSPRISLTMEQTAHGPAYVVADNGAGFDMRYVDKLFGAFQRLHGMDEFEGTGIGLATVQRIINRHGGSIWAESAVNEGARFYFQLHKTEFANVQDKMEGSHA